MPTNKRAHNSKAPQEIRYLEKVFTGPADIYRHGQPVPLVSLETFIARFRRLVANGLLDESNIEEALSLDVEAFRIKFGSRRTYVEIDGKEVNLQSLYDRHCSIAVIPYSNFRTRCLALREKKLLAMSSVMDALKFDAPRWRTWYGGGRRRAFTYYGEEFPEHVGKSFRSISSFLDAIGRYDDRPLIWARLKSGWNLDDALTIPVAYESKRTGSIYKLTRIKTGQIYVGLTVTTVDQRWAIHIRRAMTGTKTRLAAAIREDGPEGFNVTILEDGISDTDLLARRECFWAEQLDAYGEAGLNTAPAGSLGGPRGNSITINGEIFRSMVEAAEVLAQRTGIASHVALTRLNKGLPLPKAHEVRTHSKHPDAGTNLFRRWLGLLKRHSGAIAERWVLSYDAYKADVSPVPEQMELVRIDSDLPWGPGNVQWVSNQVKMERNHGKSVVINGIAFPTLRTAAEAYGIGVSTLNDRIHRQGMSIDEAVRAPLGVTSYKCEEILIVVDGLRFRSKRQAILHLSRSRGWSVDKAKYRFAVGNF